MVVPTMSPGYTPTSDSTKTAVANYLLDHVGQWIDAATFEEIGGASGNRRMRELRENGWLISSQRSAETNTRQYRLAKSPTKAIQAKFRTPSKTR